jgi:ATP/maltotriose-dependent transcriptional regulator MalT
MPRLDPVLRHATTAPAFDPNKIHRERLVDLIHSHLPKKLIVVAAPAGYGKTTLLADFTAHSDFPIFWVRLTPADADERRLAEMIVATLRRRFRRVMKETRLNALAGATPEALGRALGESMSAVGEPFVLVLDDVHHLNPSTAALALMDAMLESMPVDASLIAAGREVLEVSLAKLMAQESLAGMGPQDLASPRRSCAPGRALQRLSDRASGASWRDAVGWRASALRVRRGARAPADRPDPPAGHDYWPPLSSIVNQSCCAVPAGLVVPALHDGRPDTVLRRNDSCAC